MVEMMYSDGSSDDDASSQGGAFYSAPDDDAEDSDLDVPVGASLARSRDNSVVSDHPIYAELPPGAAKTMHQLPYSPTRSATNATATNTSASGGLDTSFDRPLLRPPSQQRNDKNNSDNNHNSNTSSSSSSSSTTTTTTRTTVGEWMAGVSTKLAVWIVVSCVSNAAWTATRFSLSRRTRDVDFPYFQVNFAAGVAVLPLFALAYALHWRMLSTRGRGRLHDVMTHAKWKVHIAAMAALVALGVMLLTYSGRHLSSVYQVVFAADVVLVAAVASHVLLKTALTPTERVGVVVVALAAAFSVTGSVMHGDSDDAGDGTTHVLWVVLYQAGALLMCASVLYQQWLFERVEMDVPYLLAWTTLLEFVFLVLLAPLNVVPGFGPHATFSDLVEY
eukprot:TRINITY_DN58623_c0_g2_i2.p1 TRINITY_DN58623_c0_g2~~TRINITY_DN58623_c0_g2_i2.p1  ORF type:complete len:390 (-),score=171.83 TRINITY_DN58623_c0_g2_i2:54-1223(-)